MSSSYVLLMTFSKNILDLKCFLPLSKIYLETRLSEEQSEDKMDRWRRCQNSKRIQMVGHRISSQDRAPPPKKQSFRGHRKKTPTFSWLHQTEVIPSWKQENVGNCKKEKKKCAGATNPGNVPAPAEGTTKAADMHMRTCTHASTSAPQPQAPFNTWEGSFQGLGQTLTHIFILYFTEEALFHLNRSTLSIHLNLKMSIPSLFLLTVGLPH